MHVSELIAELEALKYKHGDALIVMFDDGDGVARSIAGVYQSGSESVDYGAEVSVLIIRSTFYGA